MPLTKWKKQKLGELVDTALLRAIHACARENGCDRDGLHDAIELGFGKTSLKELTRAEAYALLNGLRGDKPSPHFRPDQRRRDAQSFHGRKNHDASADAVYQATDRERQMLRDAAALRNWSDAALTAFIQRQIGKPAVVTMADFNKVFWPLKSMNRRDGKYR